MMTGKSPALSSKFNLSYQFVLKIMSTPDFDMDNFLSNTLIVSENKKQLFSTESIKIELEKNLESINIDNQNLILMDNYDKISKKLSDTFFVVKKKEKDKLEKDKKYIEQSENFSENYEKYKIISNYKKGILSLEDNIWYNNYGIKNDIQKITEILECESYISNNKITKKGIIASVINEVNELLFAEIIFRGFLDKLDFPEIVAIISLFINERDQSSNDKYINDLNMSCNYKNTYNKIKDLTEYFMDKEDEYKLYINTDYSLHLDFVESAYIWASGGSIHEVYKNTSVYDGNFIKSIMRINNICENLMDICKTIERYDICSKLENHNDILIRDITSINSLYVK